MSQKIFLGVDGGGTKTAFTLIDEQVRVISAFEHTTSYHVQIGLDGLRQLCVEGVNAVLAQAQLNTSDITHAFFGLPAYGEDSRVTSALDAIPEFSLGHRRYTCGNDMISGWAGSLACADGINITAGTGSIGYGEHKSRVARAGGWGELFSDEGSAYWIAVQGLKTFSHMSDGRIPKGPLHAVFMTAFDLKSELDLSGILMADHATDRDKVAALSRLVADAAHKGDRAAQAIFNQAAVELVSIADAIASALDFSQHQTVNVSYSGGVFNAGDLILLPFKTCLDDSGYAYKIVSPQHPPQIGAALYAMKCGKMFQN